VAAHEPESQQLSKAMLEDPVDPCEPRRYPLLSPYRLDKDRRSSYLHSVAQIDADGIYRSETDWNGRAERQLRETLELPPDWSVLLLRSGTDALTLALKAAGVRTGDRVAVPDHAYQAVGMTVLELAAQPTWVDCDEQLWNVTETTVEASMNQHPRAVIGVDNYGLPCDWQGIGALCRERDVPFILDSCESLGAYYPEGPPSSHADFVVFSFSFAKPVHAAGMGGALCAPATTIERIRPSPRMAVWQTTMPEINAAYLTYAWPDLERSVEHLNGIYQAYEERLAPLGAMAPELPKGATGTRVLAPFRFPTDESGVGARHLIGYLNSRGIQARQYFPPQSLLFDLPPTTASGRRLHEEILCLPTGPSMPIDWVEAVVTQVGAAKEALGWKGPLKR
jgi:dTDP-4-amino-4,6-dideoxygalactose transaminase